MNIKIISIIIVARSVPEARMAKQIHTPTHPFKEKKKVKKRKKSTLHPVAGLSLTEYKPLALAVYLEQSIREVWNI